MDSSASKRRKLSPAIGIAVDASNTDIPSNARALTPGRASFMSPTKSSLARYNPSLLPRPKSVGGDGSRGGDFGSLSDRALSPRKLNAVPLRPTTPTERQARLSASPVRAGSASPRRASAVGGSFSMPARRRSRTPGRFSEPATLPPPRMSPAAPKINETVEEAVEEAVTSQLSQEPQVRMEDVVGEDVGQENVVQGGQDDGEPELPPTPEHLGLKPMPSPPKGLMSSSPSTRKSKRKGKSIRSSPLKPQEHLPRETEKPQPTETVEETSQEQPAADSRAAAAVEAEEEPEGERRQQMIDELRTQLDAIQSDVAILEKAAIDVQLADGALEKYSELVSIITSTNPNHKPLPPPTKPPSLSSKLALFLPFSKRFQPPAICSPEADTPLPSYHPLDLEDPLPQLRAFHPLALSCSEKITSEALESDTLLRQQDLTLTSPSSLLVATLHLTINTSNDSVDTLVLASLSPWANQELGSWMRAQAPTGDISTIGWACGRYWDLALKRAKIWAHCCETYPHLVPSTLSNVRSPLQETNAQSVNKSKGRQRAGTTADMDASAAEHSETVDSLSRAQLRAHLGRHSLRFSGDGVTVNFRWQIGFDWTGEAESRVGVQAAFPKAWSDADDRKSLRRLGEVFGTLVKERGVSDAIRVVIGLVWPSS